MAGLASSALAAALYALHCREGALIFVGAWYLAGAAVPALLGAWLGAKWLAGPDRPRAVP